MSAEIDCITSCIVTPPNPINAYVNGLLGFVLVVSLLLVFFGKLSPKRLQQAKSVFLLSLLGLLVNWALIRPSFETWFASLHNAILILIGLFFLLSYFFSSFIAGLGLRKIAVSPPIQVVFDQVRAVSGVPSVELVVFSSPARVAFAVSGFKKSVFISTGSIESFSKKELHHLFEHELLHFKGPFLNIKRLLHSIRAGFFGLLPVSLDDFDDYEEEQLDVLLERKGVPIRNIRKKMD